MRAIRRWATAVAAGMGLSSVITLPPRAAAPVETLAPGTLSVCMFATFPPFVGKSDDGAWEGSDVDYLNAFAAKMGLRFQPVEVADFDGLWLRPGAGACDIAASGIADLAVRRQETGAAAVWSDHYYFVLRAFGVRKADAGKLSRAGDLKGRTVLVIAGSTADVDVRSRVAHDHVPDVTVMGTSDDVENARRVRDASDGEGPFAFGSGLGTVQYLSREMGLVPVWAHCMMTPDGKVRNEPFSFIVRAKSIGVAEALNAFIAATPYGAGRGQEACPDEGR